MSEHVNMDEATQLIVASDHLLEAIRWRRRFIGCDGEDLEPDEIQAFDKLERIVAQLRTRHTFSFPPMAEEQDKWTIQVTNVETPPAKASSLDHEVGQEYDGFTYLGDGWWRKGDIVSR